MLKPSALASSHSSECRAEAGERDGSEGGRQDDGLGFFSYLSVHQRQQSRGKTHTMEKAKCKHQGSSLCFCQCMLRVKG